ncbi:hypothetical protein [Brachybacterium vulturis]|uniref:hypothetical protein n=1 Tax=Brachybacterium vulturis TaxID=2017484 RepID=UPI003735BC54
MKLPPEKAYACIAKQLRAAVDLVQHAQPTSELERLDSLYADAVILPSWSIGSAMLTAHDALDTLAFLIGARRAPSHRRAHAALIREALTGTLTTLAVLAPGSKEVRDEAARILLTLDTNSFRLAARDGASVEGPEMAAVRKTSEDAKPRIEATLEQHKFKPPSGQRLGATTLTDRGIDVFAALMAENLAPEWRDGEDLRTRLVPNLSSNATWSWNTTSGLVHGFYWPEEVLKEGDVEGFMPAVCKAAELAAALASDAANLDAGYYQESLHAFHP